jgi:putative acetyltransferase
MSTVISIRRAVATDVEALGDLYRVTIRRVSSQHYSPEQVEAWAGTAKRNESFLRRIDSQYFLIAEAEKRLAGFASITTDGSYVDFMYVDHLFQRQGVAGKLYAALEAYACTQRARNIESDVSITARPFFECKGFEVVQAQELLIAGVMLTNFKMRKTLTC